jgi:hypothetical protein
MIPPISIANPGNSIAGPVAGPNTPDLTGAALGASGNAFGPGGQRVPHVIPNPFDNTC